MAKSNSKDKSTGKKAAASKAASAKAKPEARQSAASPQPGMATADIRKDYKKTLLGRYLAKSGSPGSTGRR